MIHMSRDHALELLEARGVAVKVSAVPTGEGRCLTLSIDRTRRSPVLAVSRTTKDSHPEPSLQLFPIPYSPHSESDTDVAAIASGLGVASGTYTSLRKIIAALSNVFYQHEAYLLKALFPETKGALTVHDAHFGFDDAAFRSCKRQADIQAMRNVAADDAQEVKAEQHGITYVKLPGPGRIGTLVNGAGLAMNTVDMLVREGGTVANFLDTGGKATSETVKHSFEAILSDARVRVFFVNIFGGLTMGDMIARGVILAFRELKPTVPIVVRIRGTNEREGHAIIMESGLPLFAFDDFYDAARKAIELSEMHL
jgi:succinyl-CoA synthetase alpha subunit